MVLRFPYVTEKAMASVENESKLLFMVDKNATKTQIRHAVEKTFDHDVESVKTMMTNKGEKKAFVSFTDGKAAEEILSRLGIM